MTDQDYTFGTEPELPRGHDDRAYYRLTARAVAGIQIETSEPAESAVAGYSAPRVLQCRIRDISVGGFSLISREPFTHGAILSASVDLANGASTYGLTIEVKWCRPVEQGYLVGVGVLESDETDYLEWMEAIADALAEG